MDNFGTIIRRYVDDRKRAYEIKVNDFNQGTLDASTYLLSQWQLEEISIKYGHRNVSKEGVDMQLDKAHVPTQSEIEDIFREEEKVG